MSSLSEHEIARRKVEEGCRYSIARYQKLPCYEVRDVVVVVVCMMMIKEKEKRNKKKDEHEI